MTPILYEANETSFTSYGIGALVDAVSCNVTMRGDTQYELSMEYPVDGELFSELSGNRFIFAKPCQTDNPQPFRIYRITKPINGQVRVDARHISYDLLGIPVSPFTATSAVNFCQKIKSESLITNPFTFTTNIVNTSSMKIEEPKSARSLLSGEDDSFAAAYGGEIVFDGYNVNLLSAAGENRGMVIRYGVDIIDAKMEENIASVYTGIVPFFYEDKTLVVGDVLSVEGEFLFTRILLVDVTEYISATSPSKSAVNSVGREWLAENPVGLPKISLSLSYAQIDQVVRLYDTVTVKIEKINADVVAKVTATVYNVLKERYKSVDVGDVRPTFLVDIYDASRLRTGLLNMKRIKDKSISSSKMGSGSVGTGAIANGAVTTWKLDDHAVTSSKLSDGSVSSSKIINLSITGDKILDQAISSEKLANSAITAAKIADSAVTYDKLESSVTGYFTGAKSMSVNATQIRFGSHRLKITPDGYVVTESFQ